MRALQQFWSQGTGSKIVVLAMAGVIVLLGCFGVLLVTGSLGGKNTPTTATGTSAPSSASTSAHTKVPTVTATPSAGPPQLGATLASFTTAYGKPALQDSLGATDDFWENTQQTILIGVDLTNGRVSHIAVLGPPQSTMTQTFNSCAAFLPPDATSYSSAPPDTDYHSSIGNLVLENDGSGLCTVSIAS
jgi:hypothetical protein